MLLAPAYSSWNDHVKELLHKKRVLETMARRMCNAGMYKAWATWLENAKELKRQAVVRNKVLLRWKNQSMAKIYQFWVSSCLDSKRIKLNTTRVVNHWTRATISRALSSWILAILQTKDSAKQFVEEAAMANEEQRRSQAIELASQVDNLGVELTSSKERENQLSKKLAASWKEVAIIGRECEALRVGAEQAKRDADNLLDQLRKQDSLFKAQLQQGIYSISRELILAHKMAQELGIAMRVAEAHPHPGRKASMRLSMEGIKLAPKDGKRTFSPSTALASSGKVFHILGFRVSRLQIPSPTFG
jgi:hypothetical protein